MLYLAALLPFLAVTFAVPQSEHIDSSSTNTDYGSETDSATVSSTASSTSSLASTLTSSGSQVVSTSSYETLSESTSSLTSRSAAASGTGSVDSSLSATDGKNTTGGGSGEIEPFIGVKIQSLVNGLCLSPNPETPLTSLKTGTPIGVYPCDDAHKWDFNPESTAMIVSSTDFALDVDQTYDDGARLTLEQSVPDECLQAFYITNDARIAIQNQGFCIDQKSGSSNEVQLWKCTDENTNQMWIIIDGDSQKLIVNPKATGDGAGAPPSTTTTGPIAAQHPPTGTSSGSGSDSSADASSATSSGTSSGSISSSTTNSGTTSAASTQTDTASDKGEDASTSTSSASSTDPAPTATTLTSSTGSQS
ncbi:hypothetical protein IAU59_000967 [Kwoniella sp. CBS 9459]